MMKSVSSRSRGRPKIPLKWSRVIDFEFIHEYEAEAFDIDVDLQELEED